MIHSSLQVSNGSLQKLEQWARFHLCLLWHRVLKYWPFHSTSSPQFPQNTIAGLYKLREFFMNWNKIRNFPKFSHCGKLNVLEFQHNESSYIPRGHIEGLKSIRESTSRIIGCQIWQIFPTLRKFFIGYNLITGISVWVIEGLPSMKTFDCNNNRLKSLPNISAFFPALEELYVQGNYLKTLPDLYEFPPLVTLKSAENPYECNVTLCVENAAVVEAIREYIPGQSNMWLTSCIRWYSSCPLPPSSHGMLQRWAPEWLHQFVSLKF